MRLLARLNRRLLLRYRLEYAAALLFVYVVRSMSPLAAWGLARALGALLYRLGLRREAILRNLAVAFPGLGEAERDALGRRSMQHFLSVAVDVLFERRMISRRNVFERVRVTGWARDYLDEHGVQGFRRRARGILFLTAHLGNWELAPGFFGLLGVPVAPVFRAMRNPFMDRLVRRIRLDTQEQIIERTGAVPAVLEVLGQGGNVGLLFDQEGVQGLDVPFFGLLARTRKAPAVLARDHGARLFLGFMVREGDFLRYEARGQMLDGIARRTEDRQRDLEEITRELLARLEEEILRRPEQYFWMHRRWKRSGVHVEDLP